MMRRAWRVRNLPLRTGVRNALLLGVVSVGAVAIAGRPQTAVPATNVTYADGYELDLSPDQVVEFDRNVIVVVADVVETLAPQWNTESPGRGSLSFIFTPLKVKVLEVLRGDPRLDGGTMIVRKLGGRVGPDELVVSSSFSSSHLEVGQRVLLFLGRQLVLNSLDAATPNAIYIVDERGYATSVDGRWILDLEWFRDRIS